MRRLTRRLFGTLTLAMAVVISPVSPRVAVAQSALAPEPTYRYAGHYEGEWSAAVALDAPDASTPWPAVVDQRAGEAQGTLALDVSCDGTLSGQASGQTRQPVALAGFAADDGLPRLLSASLDLTLRGAFEGALASRGAEGRASSLEAALEGTLSDLPGELETVAAPSSVQRYYAGEAAARWSLEAGEPGRLAGLLEGFGDLLAAGPGQPGLQVRSHGQWVANRVAVALCLWRGTVQVAGAFGNQQLHDERIEITFRPTGDGRLAGEGAGEATVRGGTPGGCEYSGGGPFAVLVSGETADGRFRLRIEDFEQPQLVVATTCPSGRFLAAHPPLSTVFGPIDMHEAVGAQAHAELPDNQGDARGSLDLTIAPVLGGDPP